MRRKASRQAAQEGLYVLSCQRRASVDVQRQGAETLWQGGGEHVHTGTGQFGIEEAEGQVLDARGQAPSNLLRLEVHVSRSKVQIQLAQGGLPGQHVSKSLQAVGPNVARCKVQGALLGSQQPYYNKRTFGGLVTS